LAVFFLIFLSFTPCLLWFIFCLIKQYITYIQGSFLIMAGVCSVLLSVAARFVLEDISGFLPAAAGPFFTALVVTALPEEVAKMTVLLPFSRDRQSGLPVPLKTFCARAVCVGLAFAAFENILFAVRSPRVLLLRYFTAVPLHAACTLFASLWLYRRISSGDGTQVRYFTLSAALLFHAVYILMLSSSPSLFVFSAITAALAFLRAAYIWQSSGEPDEKY